MKNYALDAEDKNQAKVEMEKFQRRILRIVNLDPDLASSKFDIISISKLINKTNDNILAKTC